jgi:outer membrane protein assembly factor BamB
VGGDKNGTVYLVNRDNMGKYNSSGDQILQELPGAVGVHVSNAGDCNNTHNDCNYGTAAYWNGNVYFSGVNDNVKAFAIANGQLSGPTSKSPTTYGFPGATPAVSANGATNGILWVVQPIISILHAYDATNLANELYNSTQASGGRDSLRSNTKFAPPTVVNGKVFIGTKNAVVVYGLLH